MAGCTNAIEMLSVALQWLVPLRRLVPSVPVQLHAWLAPLVFKAVCPLGGATRNQIEFSERGREPTEGHLALWRENVRKCESRDDGNDRAVNHDGERERESMGVSDDCDEKWS